MTHRSVFTASLLAFSAAMAMTLAAIIIPRWISYEQSVPLGDPVRITYGLHRHCSSLTGQCIHFPTQDECHDEERTFCSLWRSVGFLMSFAVVIEGMTLIAFLVTIVGGKQKREAGWKIIVGFLLLGTAIEAAGMAIIAYLNSHDPRFDLGFFLDTSFHLCTASWVIIFLTAIGIVASRFFLEEEGGYELIPGSG